MQRLNWGGFKHAQELVYAFMLGSLEEICEALLAMAFIPYQDSVYHDRDYEGVVHFPRFEHVDPSDRIPEDVDAVDGGAASVCHDLGMVSPVKLGVNVDSKILDGFFGDFHSLGSKDWVGIL